MSSSPLVARAKTLAAFTAVALAGIAVAVAVAPRAVPWLVARCLLGLGLNRAEIAQIAATPTSGDVQAAFGYAAARRLMGRAA